MRILQNTLYVTTPNLYLSLDGENIVVQKEGKEAGRVPLHNIESVIAFGYVGASPALMGACASRDIAVTFLSMNGRFLARVVGETRGNVVLRKTQYRISDDEQTSAQMAKSFILGKLYNSRAVLERALRDYSLRLDCEKIKGISNHLVDGIRMLDDVEILDEVRGVEGEAASRYFSVLDDLILQQKNHFYYHGRNRRPPMDKVNALLSFAYTLLRHDVAAALESVGLDSYVGFLHRDRPGRQSLALDLMEEFRAIFADRFVLTLINTKQIRESGFLEKENGAVIMDDDTRKIILASWQKKKQEEIVHPFLDEKIPWGLVPYAQAILLARYLRGDIDAYPPFLWK